MIDKIIKFSIKNKLIVLLLTSAMVGFGVYSLLNIPIGAVPDITNNQVQVITTSRNLATQDVEKFLTAPVELEMANLPNVQEIRSVSKFGLSVVTIVFDDEIGTFLPRQLIAEKIKSAEEKIPTGFGSPFMGPVTTGLGEIYQYIIDVDPNYKNEYSITDLRTIQDWIVKRQLSGIPGVVEVNTWGGFLKQYEVSVNPSKLRAMNISITQVFGALEKNNSISGGGYIEKGNESFFIRGEGLVGSIEDIENIVVDNRNGVPIFIKNIAKVGYGAANRFGAITANGQGEKVLGQVMMLKGADPKKVIEAVKTRVDEIQGSLPKGVRINAFLERSELIGKTTFTIAENLILGFLIVLFVVILLLGSFRSGLVVASVIPLCMLFALSLMNVFGVDANLMSLGAIDFGIIIDGAVIIVEFIAFKITAETQTINKLPKENRAEYIDQITFVGATKMMRSAIFGQIIILIVFIPILSLSGVEGKMFIPMALVFCFALLGAMLMCFTYVPVVSSLFLKPTSSKRNLSTRFVTFLENSYQPIIVWALRKKGLILSSAVALLIGIGILFSTMGGEFVPVLDEGDLVIQPVLKTGTSLTKTIETTTEIEKILLKFPEVEQVVSRIGAAEVPTDPMSMEESDIIVKLNPKQTWTTAETKDVLIDKFKEALLEIPGIDYEFTQPIEMRFNELITGVRSDLAIKIFGEDLDVLYKKALEIEKAIQNVAGASDIIVEKVAGLPQMSVKYDRAKIAKYGLNIEDLNNILTMGFAGKTAGNVFEGEKQFDLVVRFENQNRRDLESIKTTSVLLPNGSQLPFNEFAEINYTKGPAKISRDDTKRRIVIGVNVRNRDLESVVKDIQDIIQAQIKFPAGYAVQYGGQFENLRSAKARLTIAVPIALVLIFFLLYFAFNSIKEALMIYSAIPLSAVGGVLFLYMRDLPFSISAGVGFIALFGIAVLNGIVLIEEFKELKEQGIKNLNRRIIIGTKKRLRPVLLTSSAAALGFLPMAISTNAGAEVQKPLATVVIGGLITATLLTLVVLPVLYSIFDKKIKKPKFKLGNKIGASIVLLLLSNTMMFAQNKISLEKAIELAVENNKSLKASTNQITMNKQLEGTAFDIDKTEVYYNFDQNNIAPNNIPLNVWGINQSLKFPTIYGAQKSVLETNTNLSEQSYLINENILKKEVSKNYFSIVYWNSLIENYTSLDSLYQKNALNEIKKYKLGETNNLEKLTAITKQKEIELLLEQSKANLSQALTRINILIQADTFYNIEINEPKLIDIVSLDSVSNPVLKYKLLEVKKSEQLLKVNKQQLLPDLTLGVFQGYNNGSFPNKYLGIQAGIAIPLFYKSDKSKIDASKTEMLMKDNQYEDYMHQLSGKYELLLSELAMKKYELETYDLFGKELANETIMNAKKSYQSGNIDFSQYAYLLDNAMTIKTNYIKNRYLYNLTALELNYLIK